MMNTQLETIDQYLAGQPAAIKKLLTQMRTAIRKAAPGAVEAIRYGMPTFRLHDKNLVHFAAYKNHIGFYPAPSGITNFKKELAIYKTSKGAIQLPLDKVLPLNLIGEIVRYRVQETEAKLMAKAREKNLKAAK